MLSSICAVLDMPESTASTPSRPAANLRAQETAESSGRSARIRCSASAGTFASMPPFTGSMTMTSFPCLRMVS